MSIRTYETTDKTAAVELIRANTPQYFDPSEERLFSDYLDEGIGDMFVYEKEGIILGCASVNYEEKTGILSWAMVHPSHHGQKIGTELVEHRLNRIQSKGYPHVVVRTSQHTFPFYEKMGFELKYTKKDYWAKGYDLYFMQREL